jgi:hypothetical protein
MQGKATQGKRKIHQNIYGNWRGYVGGKTFKEFGTDEIAAGHWLITGSDDFDAGYATENIEAARKAAREA